jgi:hypothetical protein
MQLPRLSSSKLIHCDCAQVWLRGLSCVCRREESGVRPHLLPEFVEERRTNVRRNFWRWFWDQISKFWRMK